MYWQLNKNIYMLYMNSIYPYVCWYLIRLNIIIMNKIIFFLVFSFYCNNLTYKLIMLLIVLNFPKTILYSIFMFINIVYDLIVTNTIYEIKL